MGLEKYRKEYEKRLAEGKWVDLDYVNISAIRAENRRYDVSGQLIDRDRAVATAIFVLNPRFW